MGGGSTYIQIYIYMILCFVYRSESLQVGHRILAVNGKSTDALTHDDVIQLVKNAEEMINLEIEYDAPLDGMLVLSAVIDTETSRSCAL